MTSISPDDKSAAATPRALTIPFVMISSPRAHTETGSPFAAVGTYDTGGDTIASFRWYLERRVGAGSYTAHSDGDIVDLDKPRSGVWRTCLWAEHGNNYFYKLRVVMTLSGGSTHDNEEEPFQVVEKPLVLFQYPSPGTDASGGLDVGGVVMNPATPIEIQVFDIIRAPHFPAVPIPVRFWSFMGLAANTTGEGNHLEVRVHNPLTGATHTYTLGGLRL